MVVRPARSSFIIAASLQQRSSALSRTCSASSGRITTIPLSSATIRSANETGAPPHVMTTPTVPRAELFVPRRAVPRANTGKPRRRMAPRSRNRPVYDESGNAPRHRSHGQHLTPDTVTRVLGLYHNYCASLSACNGHI